MTIQQQQALARAIKRVKRAAVEDATLDWSRPIEDCDKVVREESDANAQLWTLLRDYIK